MRAGYYKLTVEHALAFAARVEAEDKAREAIDAVTGSDDDEGDPEVKKQIILDGLSTFFGGDDQARRLALGDRPDSRSRNDRGRRGHWRVGEAGEISGCSDAVREVPETVPASSAEGQVDRDREPLSVVEEESLGDEATEHGAAESHLNAIW